MEDGQLLKAVLYGELAAGIKRADHPVHLFKDVQKKDMKSANNTDKWEIVSGS